MLDVGFNCGGSASQLLQPGPWGTPTGVCQFVVSKFAIRFRGLLWRFILWPKSPRLSQHTDEIRPVAEYTIGATSGSSVRSFFTGKPLGLSCCFDGCVFRLPGDAEVAV